LSKKTRVVRGALVRSLEEATNVAKLIEEMRDGTRHRIKTRYRPDILSVLREHATKND